MTPALRDGAAYGSLAFGLGFLFGACRELVLVPGLGPRAGRLVEFCEVTSAVASLGARLGRQWPHAAERRVARGAAGVAILLALDGALAVGVMRQPARDWLRTLNPLAGSPFAIGLAVMAVAPLLGSRR